MARTVTCLTRLLDVITPFEGDRRIQTVFTYPTEDVAILGGGVQEFLSDLRAPTIPWSQAVAARPNLVVAASENSDLHEFRAPVLLVPHGAGFQKHYPRSRAQPPVIAGMNPARLLRDGRVVPTAIALSHPDQRDHLRAACPQAVDNCVVVGDPCLDRLLASAHRRAAYRDALGVGARHLVVVTSTWGPAGLLGRWPDLPDRLLAQLPYDEFQVAAILHPGIWYGHGPWQVNAWLRDARQRGLLLVPPEEGWRATLTAADCVVGDEGSVSLYAAATGTPLALATWDSPSTVPRSPMAQLARRAPRLDMARELSAQITAVIEEHRPENREGIADLAFAHRGDSGRRLASVMYRLLDLDEPSARRTARAVPVPELDRCAVESFVACGEFSAGDDGDLVTVRRFPGVVQVDPRRPLPSRHLVADVEALDPAMVESASILFSRTRHRGVAGFDDWASDTLDRWPVARMVAAPVDDRRCHVMVRDSAGPACRRFELAAGSASPSPDPLVFASALYVVMNHRAREPRGALGVRTGRRVTTVTVRTDLSRPFGTGG